MSYKTVKKNAMAEFTEKKSRFIGYVMPVCNVEQANDFIEKISRQHRDARHNVFAYILKTGEKRYSDNGEPQGTAGVPILDFMEKTGICDVICVVTRYFGGILLGTGGLTRAYGLAAKLAVNSAEIIEMADCTDFTIETDYRFYGKVSYIFPRYKIKELENNFSDKVTLRLRIKENLLENFKAELNEITGGQYSLEKEEKIFAEI